MYIILSRADISACILFSSHVRETGELVLSPLDFRPQMVLGVALSDVLDQWAVVGQEVGRDVDSLGVPDLAVLQAVLLWVQSSKEPQFRSNAKV